MVGRGLVGLAAANENDIHGYVSCIRFISIVIGRVHSEAFVLQQGDPVDHCSAQPFGVLSCLRRMAPGESRCSGALRLLEAWAHGRAFANASDHSLLHSRHLLGDSSLESAHGLG